ncbi:hypothetical protein [Embleya sp. NPDC005575]|uniref:hypothetical protein n=1 Tax=Embleya sp. NPDC005575 TaxID=3156892 RepID=UPI00339F115B
MTEHQTPDLLPPAMWTAPEQALWQAHHAGRPLDLRTGDPARDDPAAGSDWPEERFLRAEVLAELLLAGPPKSGAVARPLRVIGARITGKLDLSAARIDIPLSVKSSCFDQTPTFDHADLVALDLDGCHLPGIEAEALRVSTWLGIRGGRVGGDLWMFNARIDGTADLGDTTVGGDFTLGSSVMGGGLRLTGFACGGEARLRSCRISGDLDLAGAALSNPGATALSASGLTVDGSFLAHGLTVRGEANLTGARIGGTLALVDVTLREPPSTGWVLLLIEAQAPMARLRPTAGSRGRVSLRDAHFGRFVDDVVGWPEAMSAELDGFTYERLTHRTSDTVRPDVTQRLTWLARQTDATSAGFSPAPYE